MIDGGPDIDRLTGAQRLSELLRCGAVRAPVESPKSDVGLSDGVRACFSFGAHPDQTHSLAPTADCLSCCLS